MREGAYIWIWGMTGAMAGLVVTADASPSPAPLLGGLLGGVIGILAAGSQSGGARWAVLGGVLAGGAAGGLVGLTVVVSAFVVDGGMLSAMCIAAAGLSGGRLAERHFPGTPADAP